MTELATETVVLFCNVIDRKKTNKTKKPFDCKEHVTIRRTTYQYNISKTFIHRKYTVDIDRIQICT